MNNFEINLKHKLDTLDELSLIYTPGVGFSSKEIAQNEKTVNCLTNRANSVAVIYDCEKNPESYIPYIQATANIIKKLTNLDAYPIVSKNYDINKLVENLTPSFAGFYIYTNKNINSFSSSIVTSNLDEFEIEQISEKANQLKAYLQQEKYEEPILDNNEFRTKSLNLRKTLKGVIETENSYKSALIQDLQELFDKSKLDTLSEEIRKNPKLAKQFTCKKNTIAIISDGSAVLGLGNIGAYAALPVMEGKAAIFKSLGDVNAVPICLKTQDINEIIAISKAISYSFGGINLEDINAPRCFEIEEKLSQCTDIPIFHDDQHGTAIIVLAGLLGALKLADKRIEDVKIVMSGAGAAAQAVAKLLLKAGAKNLIMRDIEGVISKKSAHKDKYLKAMAQVTNPNLEDGSLADILKNADVLIGLSAANIVTEDMIKSMNEKAIVFVLANPTPEIMPDKAKNAGAFIVATGRSDFENQINNSLAFPGIFKGLLQKDIQKVTDDIKYNTALAISEYASENLTPHSILPKALDKEIVEKIVNAI